MKTKLLSAVLAGFFILVSGFEIELKGQNSGNLSLEEAVNLAISNNHLLKIKKLQIDEKQQKVNEDRVKYFPAITVGGSYQYNSNLPSLAIEQGRFGQLPYGGMLIPLPAVDELIEMGNHNIYNAGVTFYQPVSQIGKINAGVEISRMELEIARTEETKTIFQVKQAVERLFFGLLILRKQIEEADIKVTLAKRRLYDAESALSAGKTIESSIYGLSANVSDEEQNLLKLKIQFDDYSDELKVLTGLDRDQVIIPEQVSTEDLLDNLPSIDTSLNIANGKNNDLKIASFLKSKADYSVKASKFTYLPDLGIQGGYTYQEGNVIYPKNNTFIGASLKWNIQDAFLNRTIQRQRTFIRYQSEENLANTKEQVSKDIAKAYRKLRQSEELINVAGKVVDFRREDLKIISDKRASGLNLETDVLTAKASMAKAESDYFAAQLNYRIALTELKILTGNY